MDAQGAWTAGAQVRLRPTAWQRAPFLLVFAILPTEMIVISPSVGIALAAPPLAAALGTWLLLGRAGVELTPEGAIVRTLRRRQIAWRDVQYVQIQRFSGNRVVVLYEAGGRRTRLRAPSTGFLNWDKRFEEKADVIGRWWETHRGVQDSVQASVEL